MNKSHINIYTNQYNRLVVNLKAVNLAQVCSWAITNWRLTAKGHTINKCMN